MGNSIVPDGLDGQPGFRPKAKSHDGTSSTQAGGQHNEPSHYGRLRATRHSGMVIYHGLLTSDIHPDQTNYESDFQDKPQIPCEKSPMSVVAEGEVGECKTSQPVKQAMSAGLDDSAEYSKLTTSLNSASASQWSAQSISEEVDRPLNNTVANQLPIARSLRLLPACIHLLDPWARMRALLCNFCGGDYRAVSSSPP